MTPIAEFETGRAQPMVSLCVVRRERQRRTAARRRIGMPALQAQGLAQPNMRLCAVRVSPQRCAVTGFGCGMCTRPYMRFAGLLVRETRRACGVRRDTFTGRAGSEQASPPLFKSA
jgi:hypothetical protein